MSRKSLHSRWCSRTCPHTPLSTLPPVLALMPPCVWGKVRQGKELTPPLDCTGTDLPPASVRFHIWPPPIRGPPEVHAYTDYTNDIASLHEQLAALRLCLNNMDERVAETEIDRMELGDRVDTLRKAVCSKIKCLAKATGNEDLYRSRDPK